jgi:hypothetical protein
MDDKRENKKNESKERKIRKITKPDPWFLMIWAVQE